MTFPFTDTAGTKRRPALILLDTGDEDVIVARVTGQPVQAAFDVELVEWQQTGLRFPSVARIHKVATIEKALIVNSLGKVGDGDWVRVCTKLRQLWGVSP